MGMKPHKPRAAKRAVRRLFFFPLRRRKPPCWRTCAYSRILLCVWAVDWGVDCCGLVPWAVLWIAVECTVDCCGVYWDLLWISVDLPWIGVWIHCGLEDGFSYDFRANGLSYALECGSRYGSYGLLYGFVWTCMASYGPCMVWLRMDLVWYGFVWTLYGFVWTPLV
jgi:hypothetical protein